MRLLPLLLLLACAGPAEYQRGSPVPTRPPYNPTTDSPITTGQPGHLVPHALPRSPHQRQLPPPGKHPGLWGADPPKASAQGDDPATLGGVAVPLGDGSSTSRGWAKACAGAIEEITGDLKHFARLDALTTNDVRCLRATLYSRCIQRVAEETERVSSPGARAARRLASDTLVFLRTECRRLDNDATPDVADVIRDDLDAVLKEFFKHDPT